MALTFGIGGKCHVVIHGLSPWNEENSDRVIVVAHVVMVDSRDVPRCRQRLSRDRETRGAHTCVHRELVVIRDWPVTRSIVSITVGVVGRQETAEGRQRSSPVRMLQIVADSVVLAVPCRRALWILFFQERRAE